jgi:hypothetical protein
VAVTRFLPGVFSFLCTLSLLERICSQANNVFFQPQSPLSPGESVLQLANKPHIVYHCMATQPTRKNGHDFPTSSTMVDGIMDMATDKAPHIGSTLR